MSQYGVIAAVLGAVAAALAATSVHGADGEPGVASDTPFAAERLRSFVDAWQGTWVVKGGMMGRLVAWRVEGADVTVFDGRNTYERRFEIVAPCKLQIVDDAGGGTLYPFAIGEERRYAGLGDAGVATDRRTVACADGKLYVVRDGSCRVWNKSFGEWKLKHPDQVSDAGACKSGNGYVEAGGVRLEKTDGVLLNHQMQDSPVRRVETFEQAREMVRNQ